MKRLSYSSSDIPVYYLTTSLLTLEDRKIHRVTEEQLAAIQGELADQVVRTLTRGDGSPNRFITSTKSTRPAAGDVPVLDLLKVEDDVDPPTPLQLARSENELLRAKNQLLEEELAQKTEELAGEVHDLLNEPQS